MRKFYINSKRGATSIMEVEIQLVTPLEDCSVLWLQPGEYKARITEPQSLLLKVEKVVEGKKEVSFVPDVFCWHAFYETVEDAREVVAKNIRFEMQTFAESKHREVATDEEVGSAIAAVQVEMLKV